MSPEQLDGEAIGQGYLGTAVDVWAAGVLLIVMLLGASPARQAPRRGPWGAWPCALGFAAEMRTNAALRRRARMKWAFFLCKQGLIARLGLPAIYSQISVRSLYRSAHFTHQTETYKFHSRSRTRGPSHRVLEPFTWKFDSRGWEAGIAA